MSCIYTSSIPQYHKTALHHASEGGFCYIVQLLLENGADHNVQDMVSVLLDNSRYCTLDIPCTLFSLHYCIYMYTVKYS